MGYLTLTAVVVLSFTGVSSADDVCEVEPQLWSNLLEEWATAPRSDRHGRIMALPPSQGYYVTDRVDRPPPPPHHFGPPHGHPHGPYGPPHGSHGPSHGPPPHGPPPHGPPQHGPPPHGPPPHGPPPHGPPPHGHPPHGPPPNGPTPHGHPPDGPPPHNLPPHMSPQSHHHDQHHNLHRGPMPIPHDHGPDSTPHYDYNYLQDQGSSSTQEHQDLAHPPEHSYPHYEPQNDQSYQQQESPQTEQTIPNEQPQPSQEVPPSEPSFTSGAPLMAGPAPYEEWRTPSGPGKIVNRPPNSNKDKFRPSPEYPSQNHVPPHNSRPPVDRLDTPPPPPPRKQVSETDLYLLSAIEKLSYKVDLMEKRLRKMEDTMHYLVIGADKDPEPCKPNFTRVGGICYHISPEPADWKTASVSCRKLKAHLLEVDNEKERRKIVSAMMADKKTKGLDIWTGGLNPGLLWIWSHSARAVLPNNTVAGNSTITIVGDGRCLALVHDPAINNYVYRGQDCAFRHRFVCELPDSEAREILSNEVERTARARATHSSRKGRHFAIDGADTQ